jgi:hypothetical protein
LETGEFIDFFGDEEELDCPEGIEFNEHGELFVVSFLAHGARFPTEIYTRGCH